jgi:hypothetical protein
MCATSWSSRAVSWWHAVCPAQRASASSTGPCGTRAADRLRLRMPSRKDAGRRRESGVGPAMGCFQARVTTFDADRRLDGSMAAQADDRPGDWLSAHDSLQAAASDREYFVTTRPSPGWPGLQVERQPCRVTGGDRGGERRLPGRRAPCAELGCAVDKPRSFSIICPIYNPRVSGLPWAVKEVASAWAGDDHKTDALSRTYERDTAVLGRVSRSATPDKLNPQSALRAAGGCP